MLSILQDLGKSYVNTYDGLPKTVWHGALIGFLESTFFSAFYFFSNYFVYSLHFSVAIAGFLMACFGAGAMIGGLFGGILADKFTPQRILPICLSFQILGFLLLLIFKDIQYLVPDIFFIGLTTYSFITTNYLLTLNACEAQPILRLRAIGLLSAGSNLGIGISALLIGVFFSHDFLKLLKLFSALQVCLLVYVLMYAKKYNKMNFNQMKSLPSDKLQKCGNHVRITKISVLITLSCVLLMGAVFSQTSTIFSIFFQEKFPAMGLKSVSLIFAVNTFLVVLFQTPVSYFCRNVEKPVLMVGLGSLFIGFGMYNLSLIGQFAFAILACCIYTLGEMLFFSSAQLICYNQAPKQHRGRQLGIYRLTYGMSKILGPATMGMVYQSFGSETLFYLSGGIGLSCFLICFAGKD